MCYFNTSGILGIIRKVVVMIKESIVFFYSKNHGVFLGNILKEDNRAKNK